MNGIGRIKPSKVKGTGTEWCGENMSI